MQTDLAIEKMSVPEVRKLFDDLNEKNQMLESHLNIMKKCFHVFDKFKSFLEKICHKLDKYITEEESKQLSDFQRQMADIYEGQISANILMEELSNSSVDSSIAEMSVKRSGPNGSNGSKTKDTSCKSEVVPLFCCLIDTCNQVFNNKADLKKHRNNCPPPITLSDEEPDQSTYSLRKRISSKVATNMNKDKRLKMAPKTTKKTEMSCQTPFSAALMSLGSESQPHSNQMSTNGQKSYLCYYPGCEYSGNSLMAFFEHRVSRHSTTESDQNEQKRTATNEELIVSHNTDSNESLGHWMDRTSDSFFKCSDNSCGQLFPENSDLLRHMEVHSTTSRSPEVVFLDSDLKEEQEEYQYRSEGIDNSGHVLGMDQFEEEGRSVNSVAIEKSYANDRPFKMTLTSNKLSANSLSFDLISESNKLVIECTEKSCEMTFKEDMDLLVHLKAVHNKKVKKCTFSGCPFLYENRKFLWEHMKSCHKGQERPFKCTHPSCKNTFLTEADLNRHITSFHAIDRHSTLAKIFVSNTLSNCQSVKRAKPFH